MKAREGAKPGAGFEVRKGDRGLSLGAWYALGLYVSRIVAITFFEVRLFHSRRIPASGAAVLAGNHQSMLDPWLLGLCVRRRSAYLARDTLFRVPILGRLIRSYDAFPVPRESSAPRRAIEVCLEILSKARALILFPEGTRSYDGRLQPLRRGISLIVKRSRAPVVPVLVHGCHALLPRGRMIPRAGQARLVFGNPLQIAESESSDSFMERLASAYQDLAREAGAMEVLPESVAGARMDLEPMIPGRG